MREHRDPRRDDSFDHEAAEHEEDLEVERRRGPVPGKRPLTRSLAELVHGGDVRVAREARERGGAPPRVPIGHTPAFAGGLIGALYRKEAADAELADDAEDRVRSAQSGGGRELPAKLRRRLEMALGVDLKDVRVHTGTESDEAARSVGALAYTLGRSIHFAAGHYDPDSDSGQRLIAHEVAHTVQQRGASSAGGLEVSRPGDSHEREADHFADRFVTRGPSPVPPVSPVSVGVVARAAVHRRAGGSPVDAIAKKIGSSESEAKAALRRAGPNRGVVEQAIRRNFDAETAKEIITSVPAGAGSAPPEVKGKEAKAKAPTQKAGDQAGAKGKAAGGDAKPAGGGQGKLGKGGADAPAPDVASSNLEPISSGELQLVYGELVEHQAWGGAAAQVGEAGSAARADFILDQTGRGLLAGAASGFAMGAAMGAVGQLAARYAPIPGVGAILAGGFAAYGLLTRDWGATADTIGKFGEGEGYEQIANTLAAISEVIDIIVNVMNVIAGIIGVISAIMWIVSIITVGVASPLAGTLSAIALAIVTVAGILDNVNNLVLQPAVLMFRALHTFTSDADPREIEEQGAGLADSAGKIGSAIGGELGGRAGGGLAKAGIARADARGSSSAATGDTTVEPPSRGARAVEGDAPAGGRSTPDADAPAARVDEPDAPAGRAGEAGPARSEPDAGAARAQEQAQRVQEQTAEAGQVRQEAELTAQQKIQRAVTEHRQRVEDVEARRQDEARRSGEDAAQRADQEIQTELQTRLEEIDSRLQQELDAAPGRGTEVETRMKGAADARRDTQTAASETTFQRQLQAAEAQHQRDLDAARDSYHATAERIRSERQALQQSHQESLAAAQRIEDPEVRAQHLAELGSSHDARSSQLTGRLSEAEATHRQALAEASQRSRQTAESARSEHMQRIEDINGRWVDEQLAATQSGRQAEIEARSQAQREARGGRSEAEGSARGRAGEVDAARTGAEAETHQRLDQEVADSRTGMRSARRGNRLDALMEASRASRDRAQADQAGERQEWDEAQSQRGWAGKAGHRALKEVKGLFWADWSATWKMIRGHEYEQTPQGHNRWAPLGDPANPAPVSDRQFSTDTSLIGKGVGKAALKHIWDIEGAAKEAFGVEYKSQEDKDKAKDDPFFHKAVSQPGSYWSGKKGGLLGDDAGMWSAQKEKDATHEARFAGDTPAGKTARPNVEYPPPPAGITPEALQQIQAYTESQYKTAAEAERAKRAMTMEEAARSKDAERLTQLEAEAAKADEVQKAHLKSVAQKKQANADQQSRQGKAQGAVGQYASRAAGISALTVPLAAFYGFAWIGAELGSDDFARMAADAKKLIGQFDHMKKAMAAQKEAQPAVAQKIQGEGERIGATEQKGQQTGQSLDESKAKLDEVDATNKQRQQEAASARDQAAQQQSKHESRAQSGEQLYAQNRAALVSWAQAHKAAREAAYSGKQLKPGDGAVTIPAPQKPAQEPAGGGGGGGEPAGSKSAGDEKPAQDAKTSKDAKDEGKKVGDEAGAADQKAMHEPSSGPGAKDAGADQKAAIPDDKAAADKLIDDAKAPSDQKEPAAKQAVQGRGPMDGSDIHAHAERGLGGGARELPHRDAIQQSFGHHDIRDVRAHIGGPARDASAAMGARAYASGDAVAFADEPDLHLAAHEAAHVVQQRGGVRLSGGVGRAGDEYEQHADVVADLVVRGQSAEPVLDQMAHRGAAGGPAVQHDKEHDESLGERVRRTVDPQRAAAHRAERQHEHESGRVLEQDTYDGTDIGVVDGEGNPVRRQVGGADREGTTHLGRGESIRGGTSTQAGERAGRPVHVDQVDREHRTVGGRTRQAGTQVRGEDAAAMAGDLRDQLVEYRKEVSENLPRERRALQQERAELERDRERVERNRERTAPELMEGYEREHAARAKALTERQRDLDAFEQDLPRIDRDIARLKEVKPADELDVVREIAGAHKLIVAPQERVAEQDMVTRQRGLDPEAGPGQLRHREVTAWEQSSDEGRLKASRSSSREVDVREGKYTHTSGTDREEVDAAGKRTRRATERRTTVAVDGGLGAARRREDVRVDTDAQGEERTRTESAEGRGKIIADEDGWGVSLGAGASQEVKRGKTGSDSIEAGQDVIIRENSLGTAGQVKTEHKRGEYTFGSRVSNDGSFTIDIERQNNETPPTYRLVFTIHVGLAGQIDAGRGSEKKKGFRAGVHVRGGASGDLILRRALTYDQARRYWDEAERRDRDEGHKKRANASLPEFGRLDRIMAGAENADQMENALAVTGAPGAARGMATGEETELTLRGEVGAGGNLGHRGSGHNFGIEGEEAQSWTRRVLISRIEIDGQPRVRVTVTYEHSDQWHVSGEGSVGGGPTVGARRGGSTGDGDSVRFTLDPEDPNFDEHYQTIVRTTNRSELRVLARNREYQQELDYTEHSESESTEGSESVEQGIGIGQSRTGLYKESVRRGRDDDGQRHLSGVVDGSRDESLKITGRGDTLAAGGNEGSVHSVVERDGQMDVTLEEREHGSDPLRSYRAGRDAMKKADAEERARHALGASPRDRLRQLLSTEYSTLRGFNLDEGDIETVVARAADRAKWDSCASSPRIIDEWHTLRSQLRHPETDSEEAQIDRTVARRLAIARHLARFYQAHGQRAQIAMHNVLRNWGSAGLASVTRDAESAQLGSEFEWPHSLRSRQATFEAIRAEVRDLERAASGQRTQGDTGESSEADRYARAGHLFEQATGVYTAVQQSSDFDSEGARAAMMTHIDEYRDRLRRLRISYREQQRAAREARRTVRDGQGAAPAGGGDDGEMDNLDRMMQEANEANATPERQQAIQSDLARQRVDQQMAQSRIRSILHRLRDFKRREQAELRRINALSYNYSDREEVTSACGQLHAMALTWYDEVRGLRSAYETAGVPESDWEVSTEGGRRSRDLEPEMGWLVQIYLRASEGNSVDDGRTRTNQWLRQFREY